jgi:hypothetical protein
VGAPTREVSGRLSAVTLRVSEARAAFTLQWFIWRHVRLHRHSQTAELGDRSDVGHLRAPRHWYNEARVGRTFLGGVLDAAAGPELHDPLDMNVQGAVAHSGPPEARKCETSHPPSRQGTAGR